MKCFIKNKNINYCKLEEIYKYKKNLIIAKNHHLKKKILSCVECGVSYCDNITNDVMNNFYEKNYNLEYGDKSYNKIRKNKFYRFNSRFLSQVLFYFQFSTLFANIKILEIGPSYLGVLPTLKFFQKKINYSYFDQLESKIISEHGGKKIGNSLDFAKLKIKKYDLIWMSHVMEHYIPSHLSKIFISLKSCLNKNGRIFIEIPNDILSKSFTMPHTLFFTEKFLRKFFINLGFKIISLNAINLKYNRFQKKEVKNYLSPKKNYLWFFYRRLQNILPVYFLEKFSFNNFIRKGPYTDMPIIRIIIEK
jgi:hypothetical protein